MKVWTIQRLEKDVYGLIMAQSLPKESFSDCCKRLFESCNETPGKHQQNLVDTGLETRLKHLSQRIDDLETRLKHHQNLVDTPALPVCETPVKLDMGMIE